MDWVISLFTTTDSVAHIAILYALVISVGVLLGKIKVGGISLGVTFILFAGIAAGHFGLTAPTPILTFVQDFGLVLFVFMIGLQVGPGFFESLKEGGITLNSMAVSIILLDILVMFGCYYLFFDTSNPVNLPMLVGVLYGAVTNTPGLGAANEALTELFPNGAPTIANGYACAYPLGVVSMILSSILLRYICKVSLKKEEDDLEEKASGNTAAKPYSMHLIVQNTYLAGHTILEIHDFMKRDFVFSRILRNGEMIVPKSKTTLEIDDKVLCVCAEADAEAIIAFVGPKTEVPEFVTQDKQQMISKRILVTKDRVNGKTLASMHFSSVYGVNITRVTRQGMDLFASPHLSLQVGDRVMVVGEKTSVERVSSLLGNAVKRLDHPNLATLFIGITLGILLGSIPVMVPNIPVPLKLGIAGGPLIVAILIGRFGNKLKLVTYTTTSANMMLREVGLALFLSSVGIKAGANFVNTVVAGDGLMYVFCGLLITTIPILIIGTIARMKFHVNYFTLIGMIAGAHTDPPALAYANSVCSKEAPAVGYSTVYPLTMFLRIFTAQIIVIFFCG